MLRLFKKLGNGCFASGNLRYFMRGSNGRSNRPFAKIQPPSLPIHEITEKLPLRCLLKPFIFTISFSGGVFICSAIWQYENMRKRTIKILSSWFDVQYSPAYKKGRLRQKFNNWWMTKTYGEKMALAIIAINIGVFGLWKIPSLQPFMIKYFCSSPANKAVCLPMVLSSFSHYNFFHMAANMYVLYSFSTISTAYLGREQFLAMYCSAGVISSFSSHLYKVLIGCYNPSLGASGAIMTILAMYCLQFPNDYLQIIFFPFYSISASHSLKALLAFDTIGALVKWKFFDHAAHLGGSIFGIFYFYYGGRLIWGNRDYIFNWWHKLRNKPNQ